MSETPCDEDLVRTYQEEPGSPRGRAAVEALFARYETRVYAWCRRILREREAALDLAQDALVSAYRALPGFEHRSRFSSWLFAIARHGCLRELQRRRETREVRPEDRMDDEADPEREFGTREEFARVIEAVEASLAPLERRALWLRCDHELPVEEITRLLALTSSSGARGLLQTARRKLRAALGRRGDAEGGAQ